MFFCSSAAAERCGGGQIGIMALRAFYPLYQLGNPPTRIFRTDYFLTLVRPGIPLPEDTVQFRIPMDMTRVELKEYLEKIYNVPVAAVRTRIQFGSNKQRDDRNRRIKKPDYKVAYVQLGIEKRLSPGETGCKFQAVWTEGSAFKFFEGEKIWEKILGINLDDKLLKEASRSKQSKSYRLKTIEAEGQTFQFPDLFPDKDKAPEPESSEEIENKIEKEKQKKINDLKRGDVPNWFWH